MKGRIFFGSTVVVVGVLLLLMALDLVPLDGIGELVVYIPSLSLSCGALSFSHRASSGGPQDRLP